MIHHVTFGFLIGMMSSCFTCNHRWWLHVKCEIKYWNNFQIISKLDSLRWFSQHRSRTPHLGVRTQGTMTPKFELGRYFCTMLLRPKFHHPTFTRSEIIVSDKQTNTQTNRRRWKHPTLFATLRRLVIFFVSDVTTSLTTSTPAVPNCCCFEGSSAILV